MGPDFLLRCTKGRPGYQTTRVSWLMARSRRAGRPISLAQWCKNPMRATKRALKRISTHASPTVSDATVFLRAIVVGVYTEMGSGWLLAMPLLKKIEL
jgi:hypothetical protein